jgi:carboxymethylenebutenolidase
MATNTQIPTLDHAQSIPAYVVQPNGTPQAAIIVIQEIFGVNRGIAKKAEDWAALGYLAIAPDVFWRQQPGVELNPDIPAEFQQGVAIMLKHDFFLGMQDIEAIIHWVRREQGIGKVGLVGFCMGGKIAYMTAARTDIDASVGYYGAGIDKMLNEAGAIAKPLMLHIPVADAFVPAEAQQAVHDGLDSNPHVTLYDYEGLNHGFADTFGERRDEAGAKLADERTKAFFAENLRA